MKGVLSAERKAGTRRCLPFALWFSPQAVNVSFDCQPAELNVPVAVASSTLTTLLAQRFSLDASSQSSHSTLGDSTHCCTVCVTEAELSVMFESPLQVAFTAVEPTGNVEVVNLALPPLS